MLVRLPSSSMTSFGTRWSHSRWLRSGVALRPVAFAAVALVLVVSAVLGMDLDPFGALFRYALEVQVILAVALGALASWWAASRGQTWDADLIPALVGAVGAFTLFGLLHGTPWGPGGIDGDAAFRTEAVTRFATTLGTADFTYRDLPSFYAPAYFWVLGRVADLFGVEPWRMIKYGTVVSAMVVPVVTYLLWRRIVPVRVAALMSVLVLVVETHYFYETYAWIVVFAIIPWWVLVVHGVHRPNVGPPSPLLLGLVGGLLFMTYYYFFVVATVAFMIHVGLMLFQRRDVWPALSRSLLTFAVAGVVSSPFWLPLGISIVTTGHFDSSLNRWFSDTHGIPQLPFVSFTPVGILSLAGLFYLALTAREPLSRSLLILLGGVTAWYLIGLPGALIDFPLLTFRAKPLIPIILFIGGVLALARGWTAAQRWLAGTELARMRLGLAIVALVFAFIGARAYMVAVTRSDLIRAAHAAPLPSGGLSKYAPEDSAPSAVPIDAIRTVIDARHDGNDNPVILSDRPDVLATTPYFGFSQWQVYYAHPAAGFHARIEYLRELAAMSSAREFAEASDANEFDSIDGFVLADAEQMLEFHYRDDNFPDRTIAGTVSFPRFLFESAAFEVIDLGEYVVAMRR